MKMGEKCEGGYIRLVYVPLSTTQHKIRKTLSVVFGLCRKWKMVPFFMKNIVVSKREELLKRKKDLYDVVLTLHETNKTRNGEALSRLLLRGVTNRTIKRGKTFMVHCIWLYGFLDWTKDSWYILIKCSNQIMRTWWSIALIFVFFCLNWSKYGNNKCTTVVLQVV